MQEQAEELVIHHAPVVVTQADTDATLIGLWLDGRSATTRRAYAADVRAATFPGEAEVYRFKPKG